MVSACFRTRSGRFWKRCAPSNNVHFRIGYAVVAAILVCALSGCEEEDYTTTYRIPSPSGTRVALKTYSDLTPFRYIISIQEAASEAGVQPTPVMTGLVPHGERGTDATLLSWRGDDTLDVLIPNGGQAAVSCDSVGSLSIRYDHYDPKSSIKGKDLEQARNLKEVAYKPDEISGDRLINCSIVAQGIDPKSGRRVGVVLTGHGIKLKYTQEGSGLFSGGSGSFSATFFVSNAPATDRDSPTLTRVEIERVPIFDEHLAPVHGPLQDSSTEGRVSTTIIRLLGSSEYQTVSYGFLQNPVISAMFERIRAGKLAVTYAFGRDDAAATYRFDRPIDKRSARVYQGCEAKAVILPRPVGSLLKTNHNAKKQFLLLP